MEENFPRPAAATGAGGNPDDTAGQDWDEKNQILFSWICVAVDDNTAEKLMAKFHDRHGRNAWAFLCNMYERKSISTLEDLERELDNLELVEGGDLDEHISKVRTLCQRIKDIKPTYMDDCKEVRKILIRGLPHYFSGYAGQVYAEEVDNVKLDTVVKTLQGIDRYWHEKNRTGGKTNEEHAFAAPGKKGHSLTQRRNDSSSDRSKDKQERRPGACNFCKKPGHWKRDCRTYKAHIARQNSDTKKKSAMKEESLMVRNVDEEQQQIPSQFL